MTYAPKIASVAACTYCHALTELRDGSLFVCAECAETSPEGRIERAKIYLHRLTLLLDTKIAPEDLKRSG